MTRSSFLMIVFLVLLISCNKKHDFNRSKEIKKYYLVYRNHSSSVDTVQYKDDSARLNSLNIIDSLEIEYQKRYITIRKLTNLPNAPTDGEFVAYWEKNIGTFYSRSLTWYNFTILQTDNDSINKYIMGLLGNLLLYEKMYSAPKYPESKIKFNPPKIDK